MLSKRTFGRIRPRKAPWSAARRIAAMGLLCLCMAVWSAGAFAAAPPASLIPAPDADGFWGYVDADSHRVLIPPRYLEAAFFVNGLAVVKAADFKQPKNARDQNGAQHTVYPVGSGIIDTKGRELLPPLFSSVSPVSAEGGDGLKQFDNPKPFNKLFVVKQDAYLTVFLPEERELIRTQRQTESLIGVFHAERGWILLPGKYDSVDFYPDGSFSYNGVFNINNAVYQPPKGHKLTQYDAATQTFMFADAQASVKGVMALDGRIIIPADYHEIAALPSLRLWAASRVTAEGKAKALLSITSKKNVSESDTPVAVDIFAYDGRKVHSFRARYHPDMHGDEVRYSYKGREYSYNARTGEEGPREAQPMRSAPDADWLIFKEGYKYGIQSRNGTMAVPASYGLLEGLGDGLFMAAHSNEYYRNDRGLIDSTGRVILPLEYGKVESLMCSGKRILHVTKWDSVIAGGAGAGLAEPDGSFLTPLRYSNRISFSGKDRAVVYRSTGHGVLDCTGREVIPCVYASIHDLETDLKQPYYLAEKKRLWGMLGADGQEAAPFRYGYIHADEQLGASGWVRVENAERSKQGAFNVRTKVEIAPEYTSIHVHAGCITAYDAADFDKNVKENYRLLDFSGKLLGEYEHITEERAMPDVLIVQQGGLYGLVDAKTGGELVPCRYRNLYGVHQGFWKATGVLGDVLINAKGMEYRIQ